MKRSEPAPTPATPPAGRSRGARPIRLVQRRPLPPALEDRDLEGAVKKPFPSEVQSHAGHPGRRPVRPGRLGLRGQMGRLPLARRDQGRQGPPRLPQRQDAERPVPDRRRGLERLSRRCRVRRRDRGRGREGPAAFPGPAEFDARRGRPHPLLRLRRPLCRGIRPPGAPAQAPPGHPGEAPARLRDGAVERGDRKDGPGLLPRRGEERPRGRHGQGHEQPLSLGRADEGVAQDQDPKRAGGGHLRLHPAAGLPQVFRGPDPGRLQEGQAHLHRPRRHGLHRAHAERHPRQADASRDAPLPFRRGARNQHAGDLGRAAPDLRGQVQRMDRRRAHAAPRLPGTPGGQERP